MAYSKRLYTIASKSGLVERGNSEDPFHVLIYGLTGKTSTKDLTYKEFRTVEKEILKRSGKTKVKNQEAIEGMMSPAQQSYAWRLMYMLASFDTIPMETNISERLAGIVKREFKITSFPKAPLRTCLHKEKVI